MGKRVRHPLQVFYRGQMVQDGKSVSIQTLSQLTDSFGIARSGTKYALGNVIISELGEWWGEVLSSMFSFTNTIGEEMCCEEVW